MAAERTGKSVLLSLSRWVFPGARRWRGGKPLSFPPSKAAAPGTPGAPRATGRDGQAQLLHRWQDGKHLTWGRSGPLQLFKAGGAGWLAGFKEGMLTLQG